MLYRYGPVRSLSQGTPAWFEDEVTVHSKVYLFCLTISIGGLQVVWATVMAEGSNYLMSLGLRPSIISLAWLAGPICGTLLQPYIGYKSDFCVHRWGRRKAFMIYGTIATIISINLLSWTSELIRLCCHIFGVSTHGYGAKLAMQLLAIANVWALNIAVQPVQSSIRALIVDLCPVSQASQANSFASFVIIIGSAIGYGCGFIKIPKVVDWLHNTQFKGLCLIASIALGVTVTVTSMMIEDKPANITSTGYEKSGALQIWREIRKTFRILPLTIKTIYMIQFFAWLAWFPFLFNNVLYLSRLYEVQILLKKMGPPSTKFYNALREQSVRHAVLAMLVFAIVALSTNLCLPYFITNTDNKTSLELDTVKTEQFEASQDEFANVVQTKRRNGLTLPRAWMVSHLITALALLGATIGNNFMASVSFMSLLGISWTLTQWAPFALLNAEIASSSFSFSPTSLSFSDSEDSSRNHPQNLEPTDLRVKAGVIMAIHNVAIAAPQVLSAVVTALIYWGCRQLGVGETDAMKWVLRVGILAACNAAWTARRLW